MNEELEEKLVSAFERIATALEGLNESTRKAGKRYWPEPSEQREPVVSRVPTEEDEIRQRQGNDGTPIEQWLTDIGDPEGEEYVGERTRQWFIDHPEDRQIFAPSSEVVRPTEEVGTSTEEVKDKA